MSYTDPQPSPLPDPDGYPSTDLGVGHRPEPVLEAQQLTRLVLAVLGALSALFAALGFNLELERWDDVVGTLVGLGVLIAGVVLPRVQALKARHKVTPLADPRAGDGTRLVKAPTTPPTTYGGAQQ